MLVYNRLPDRSKLGQDEYILAASGGIDVTV